MQIDKPAIKKQFLKRRLLPKPILKGIFGCFIGCSLISCGNPIKESENGKTTRTPAATASSEFLDNETATSPPEKFEFQQMGQVYIPPMLSHIRGDRVQTLKLFFAEESETPFYCDYSSYGEGEDYQFVQCHSYTADASPNKDCSTCLSYKPGGEGPILILEPSESIRIQKSETKVEVEFEVNWF